MRERIERDPEFWDGRVIKSVEWKYGIKPFPLPDDYPALQFRITYAPSAVETGEEPYRALHQRWTVYEGPVQFPLTVGRCLLFAELMQRPRSSAKAGDEQHE